MQANQNQMKLDGRLHFRSLGHQSFLQLAPITSFVAEKHSQAPVNGSAPDRIMKLHPILDVRVLSHYQMLTERNLEQNWVVFLMLIKIKTAFGSSFSVVQIAR